MRIGIILIMLGIFERTTFKIWKNKFGRLVLCILFIGIFVDVCIFLANYLFSFGNGNNFGILAMFAGSYSLSPEINVVSYALEVVLLHVFIYWYLSSGRLKDKNWELRKQNQYLVFVTKETGLTLKINQSELGSIVVFFALLQLVISSGMFYYWVYEGKISPLFQVIGLILCVSCCGAFLIFLMSYKEFCQDNALQLILSDPIENKNVLSIFEEYCKSGTAYITNENFDVNVRTWCDIGILRVALPFDNLDKLDSRITVVISEKYIQEYKQFKIDSR